MTTSVKYSGDSCRKCGKLIELELEVPSSNPYFKDDPLEWIPKHHDCISHLREEIDDLRRELEHLRNQIARLSPSI